MANNDDEPLLCWLSNSCGRLEKKKKKSIYYNYLSGGFGLDFTVLCAWDLSVWPGNGNVGNL